jgi:hypothetical protein
MVGRVWVMRHHDDRFTAVAVQDLQQLQYLIRTFAIEISGWLITY